MFSQLSRPSVAIVMATLLVGALTSCSSDNTLAGKQSNSVTATTTDKTDPTEDSTSPSADPSPSATSSVDPANADFCEVGGEFAEGDFLTGVDIEDTDAVRKAFQEAADSVSSLDVPDAIATDWAVLTGAVDSAITALDGLDLSVEADANTFETRLKALDGGTFTPASDRVDAFLEEHCGS